MEIEQAIAERQRRLADLDRERATLQSELETLFATARILQLPLPFSEWEGEPYDTNGITPAVVTLKRPGKPPGSISKQWRDILAFLLPVENHHTLQDIESVADLYGIETDGNAVRDRLRSYVGKGYVIRHSDGRYSVAPGSVARFGLDALRNAAAPSAKEDAA